MKKNEVAIILNKYEDIIKLIENGLNKEDARIELKHLLKLLGLENEAIIIENKYWLKHQNIDNIKKNMYEQGQEYLLKYKGKTCPYELIDEFLEDLINEAPADTKKCLYHIIKIIRG